MSLISSKIKQINISGIGEVRIFRNRRNKKLCISINKSKEVRVSIPLRASFYEGEQFLFEKLEWVKQTIKKIELVNQKINIIDQNSVIKTRTRTLKLVPLGIPHFTMNLIINEIRIFYPCDIDLKCEQSQFEIKKLLLEAMKIEANDYIPSRVEKLAKIYNFQYNLVKIRNSKTRWGSCSYNNNLNLSQHLIRLPDFLSDYVILHELIHTIHKNHGPNFWKSFEKVSEDVRGKAKLLKKYKHEQII